jgi:hypothetical protein
VEESGGVGGHVSIFSLYENERDALWIRISKLDLPPLLTTPFHLSIIKFKSMNKIISFYISHEFLWISHEFL